MENQIEQLSYHIGQTLILFFELKQNTLPPPTAKPEPIERLLTPQEAGTILRVTNKTVINRIKSGKLKAIASKSGGRTYYKIRKQDLDQYISENAT